MDRCVLYGAGSSFGCSGGAAFSRDRFGASGADRHFGGHTRDRGDFMCGLGADFGYGDQAKPTTGGIVAVESSLIKRPVLLKIVKFFMAFFDKNTVCMRFSFSKIERVSL